MQYFYICVVFIAKTICYMYAFPGCLEQLVDLLTKFYEHTISVMGYPGS